MTPAEIRALPPMELGDDALRSVLNAAVIAGVKTVTTSLHRSYVAGSEPLPVPGFQRLVGLGDESLGVVEVVEVVVLPVHEVTQEIARGEGEGFASVAEWRQAHESFWIHVREIGEDGLDEQELIVVERFRWLPEQALIPTPVPRRVGIVVTDDYSEAPDRDTDPLTAELQLLGIAAEPVIWHEWDPRAEYDLLVIRTPWNYSSRTSEFLTWLNDAQTLMPVLNSPELIRWNLDKVYMHGLQAEGIAIVPTQWAKDDAALRHGLTVHRDQWVVIKPTISAGAFDTGLLRADSPAALALGQRILARGLTVMIQPEIPELSEGREKALYFIDGHHTHTISKGALLARGGGLRGGSYQEDPQLVEAGAAEVSFGERVLAASARLTETAMPLYGRIDLVDSAEFGTVLLEAELFEPALNLHLAPAAAQALAASIETRLAQFSASGANLS